MYYPSCNHCHHSGTPCHPAHQKSVPPEPPPASRLTYSEIYLYGGMASPVLLPLQQAPTRRVPPLLTQSVFNLTPKSIYYTDGSIASQLKYEALVFCFLLSELLSSWTHPLLLLFPWHPRSNRLYQRGGVRSCVFGARSRFPPDPASRQIRRGDPARSSTHTRASVRHAPDACSYVCERALMRTARTYVRI